MSDNNTSQAFDWIVANMKKLDGYTRGEDALWDVIYEKVPGLIERFESDKGLSLDVWIWSQLSWWRTKYFKRKSTLDYRFPQMPEIASGEGIELDHAAEDISFREFEVYEIIETLPDNYALLVKQHVIEGFDLEELAEAYGVDRQQINRWLQEGYVALQAFKRRAQGEL